MEIIWADEAFERWHEAADYMLHRFGVQAVERFQENTEEWEDAMLQSPMWNPY